MKKIVCIHLYNDYSGSPFILSQVINVLKNNNFNIELYTNTTKGFLTDVNVTKYDIFYKRSKYKVLILAYYILSQIILFFKLFKNKDDDVIFYINTMLPFGGALAANFLNKKVIYHIHETSIKPNILKKFLLRVIKLTSNKNIFVSSFLANCENIENINTFTIYNALPEKFTNKANKHKYTYDACFNVLMICSLKEYKGILEFLKISKLCHTNNKIITFSLVVNASPFEIDNFFLNIKIPLNTTIYPSQSNIHPFYEKAILVLNLSRIDECIEAFGLTILEAMAYGIPCIVPPIGGPLELVDHDVNGFCIDSYEVKNISNLIMKLELNREQLRPLSHRAREKSLMFNQESFSEEIIKVINE